MSQKYLAYLSSISNKNFKCYIFSLMVTRGLSSIGLCCSQGFLWLISILRNMSLIMRCARSIDSFTICLEVVMNRSASCFEMQGTQCPGGITFVKISLLCISMNSSFLKICEGCLTLSRACLWLAEGSHCQQRLKAQQVMHWQRMPMMPYSSLQLEQMTPWQMSSQSILAFLGESLLKIFPLGLTSASIICLFSTGSSFCLGSSFLIYSFLSHSFWRSSFSSRCFLKSNSIFWLKMASSIQTRLMALFDSATEMSKDLLFSLGHSQKTYILFSLAGLLPSFSSTLVPTGSYYDTQRSTASFFDYTFSTQFDSSMGRSIEWQIGAQTSTLFIAYSNSPLSPTASSATSISSLSASFTSLLFCEAGAGFLMWLSQISKEGSITSVTSMVCDRLCFMQTLLIFRPALSMMCRSSSEFKLISSLSWSKYDSR